MIVCSSNYPAYSIHFDHQRKRVVKILKDVLLSENNYHGRPAACVAMLKRMTDPKEDDTVRDLIHQTFQTLWFEPQISSQFPRSNLFDASTENNASVETECVNKWTSVAEQMVNVMNLSDRSTHLVSLVKEFANPGSINSFSSKKEKMIPASTEKIMCIDKHISSIASSLINILLSFESDQSAEMRINSKESFGDKLVTVIRTISVFAEGAPSTLVKHIDTLLPFLKADNGIREDQESLVVMHICKILSSLVQAVTCLETATLLDVCLIQDLTQIVYRFGSATMGASIELMARLSERCNNAYAENAHRNKLFILASMFYSYLFRVKDATGNVSQTPPKILSNIHRSLTGLGYICRYSKLLILSTTNELNLQIVPSSQLQWTNLLTASYAIFELFTREFDMTTRIHALRAISAVCIADPRILLYAEQRGLFTHIMSSKCETEILTEALRCWEEMLVSEENRLESGDATREMNQRDLTLSDKISGDQDGDASLIGSCCTQHAYSLLELSLHMNRNVRYQSISLIDVLLRQGLMNPMEAVRFFHDCIVHDICFVKHKSINTFL